MFKSLIMSAVIAATGAGGYAAGSGSLPALPFLDTPAASAPATAGSLPTVVAVAPVATCGQSQARRNAAGQASRAATRTTSAKASEAAAEAPEAQQAGSGPTVTASAPQAPGANPAAVNLNTASEAELEALPGIGKVLAARIIAARPFAAVSDLDRVPRVPYAEVAPHVSV